MRQTTRFVLLMVLCLCLAACANTAQSANTTVATAPENTTTPETTFETTPIYVRPSEDETLPEETMPEDVVGELFNEEENGDGESGGGSGDSGDSGASVTTGTVTSAPTGDATWLSWSAIRAFPIKSSSMSITQLRNLCIDFLRFAKTAMWIPSESINFNRSESGGADSMTAGTVYGGLPYVGTANGNIYRLMDYLDERTGKVDMRDALNITGSGGQLTRKNMEYFGNQCANGAYVGWGRVINSVNGHITACMTKARGYIPLGEYTYDYGKIDQWKNVAGYRTTDVVKANGNQVMYRSYAKLQPADGLVYWTTAGHVIMCVSAPHVEYMADGQLIDGNKSYITIIDQSTKWVQRTTTGGKVYTVKESVDAKVTFSQLYNSKYVPFTFGEFLGTDSVEATSYSFSHRADTITKKELFSSRITANYGITDAYVILTDASGNQVYKLAVRNVNSFNTTLRLVQSGSNTDAWGTWPSGTYTVRVDAQLCTGERPTVYIGTLTS